MRALHIVKEDPTKTIDNPIISESKFEKAQTQLSSYLAQIKETKDKSGFEAHEVVIVRLVNALGQAALLDVLSHYDVSTDIITIGEQTYRQTHKAPKEYQTAFGPVEIVRNVYANRK